jgi:hypothetical protein
VGAGFPKGCMKIMDANVSIVITYFQKEKVSQISHPLKLLELGAGLEPAPEEFLGYQLKYLTIYQCSRKIYRVR